MKRNLFMLVVLLFCVVMPGIAQTNRASGISGGDETKVGLAGLTARLEVEKATLASEDWELLLGLYHQLGKVQLVITMFDEKQALQHAVPTSPLARLLYAESLISIGRSAYAIAVLEGLKAQDTNNPKILYLIGVGSIQRGDMVEGMTYLKKAANLGYPPAHFELARWVSDSKEKQFHYRQVILCGEQGSVLAEKAATALLLELDRTKGGEKPK